MKMTQLPCGWIKTGKFKDSIAHYKICKHPFCVGRLQEFYKMAKLVSDDMKARKAV